MSSNGKILIYAPNDNGGLNEIKNVKNAAEKIARRLKLGVEVIRRDNLSSVWVYFENYDGQLIPIYFNYWLKCPIDEVYTKIRNMMFVLSFHPKFRGLRSIRREIMAPS
ncbi:hypothetical protein DRO54_03620 [Candidatus Bathyarchaeota archaeon]|nr:MAG: hypothetical protein DRO54_03620 [Candidatus Bathyarchaeota archaeon]